MVNLQLIDSIDGGDLVFLRNDYPLDEGIYTELYCCFFSTLNENWWADTAFDVQSEKITSRTGIALKTHNSNSTSDLNLIKKAVNDDLARLTNKNPEIKINDVALVAYSNNAIRIIIDIEGYTNDFNFIYQKTKESLDNLTYIVV